MNITPYFEKKLFIFILLLIFVALLVSEIQR